MNIRGPFVLIIYSKIYDDVQRLLGLYKSRPCDVPEKANGGKILPFLMHLLILQFGYESVLICKVKKDFSFFIWYSLSDSQIQSVFEGIQVRIETKIGGGLRFQHFPGIVINEGCKIGGNCLIFQNVTI